MYLRPHSDGRMVGEALKSHASAVKSVKHPTLRLNQAIQVRGCSPRQQSCPFGHHCGGGDSLKNEHRLPPRTYHQKKRLQQDNRNRSSILDPIAAFFDNLRECFSRFSLLHMCVSDAELPRPCRCCTCVLSTPSCSGVCGIWKDPLLELPCGTRRGAGALPRPGSMHRAQSQRAAFTVRFLLPLNLTPPIFTPLCSQKEEGVG